MDDGVVSSRTASTERTNGLWKLPADIQESISVRALSANEPGRPPTPTRVEFNDRSCLTFDRRAGVCKPVHECYPYTKAHQTLGNLETWVIGTLGTCNYVEPQGRQVSWSLCSSKWRSTERVSSVVFIALDTAINQFFHLLRFMACAAARVEQKTARQSRRRGIQLRRQLISRTLCPALWAVPIRTRGNTRSWCARLMLPTTFVFNHSIWPDFRWALWVTAKCIAADPCWTTSTF